MPSEAEVKAAEKVVARAKEDNPLLFFKPRPCQRDFFYDDHVVQFCLGGKKSGKSLCLAARFGMAMTGTEPRSMPGSLAMLPKPPVRIRWWCEDIVRSAEETLLPLIYRFLPKSQIPRDSNKWPGYNCEKNTLTLPNGSWLQFMSYGMELKKGETVEIELNGFDEPPNSKLFFSQFMRIITTGGYMWGAMTLDEEIGHDTYWVEKFVRCPPDRLKPYVRAFEFKTEENLEYLRREVPPERAARIGLVHEAIKAFYSDEQYQTAFHGKGSWRRGVVYRDFDETLHGYDVEGMDAEAFVRLARAGFGDFYAGMDHGCAHPTAVVYTFVAKRPIEPVDLFRIVEGDHIQVAEYVERGLKVPQHIPTILANHARFRPKAYFCDPHMWDEDSQAAGPNVAQMYMLAGQKLFGEPLPFWRASNPVDPGIQVVANMLKPRGGNFPWPRYRLLKGPNPRTKDAFVAWKERKDAAERPGGEKYREQYKDEMDAVRYLCVGMPEQVAERTAFGPTLPAEYGGVPLDMYCSLANFR